MTDNTETVTETVAEAVAETEAPKTRKAKAADVAETEAPKTRVLTRKAFINGRLYEAGEEVSEDADGNHLAVPKSTPAGSLTVDQLKQLLAQAQAGAKGQAAKD